MLVHHLDPVSDRASRPHAVIERSVRWLVRELGLRAGDRVLDLGCGPGLYAAALAREGIEVLGVDASRRSLDHLEAVAQREALPVRTRHGNYLEVDLGSDHDAAILIFEDYSALSPDQRVLLLSRIHRALRPGGQLLFDVTAAPAIEGARELRREEDDLMGGFWAPPPYRGVHERWVYPELRLLLDRYTIDKDGSTRQFWNWMHCLTVPEVRTELEEAGFTVHGVHGDVTGAPYDPASPVFAVHVGRPHRDT